ncbi:transposable element Tcb1 transposase [Trichonephila clavipes]|nr:transposable element Tcb1 transposase [Trichonephila clavipes]
MTKDNREEDFPVLGFYMKRHNRNSWNPGRFQRHDGSDRPRVIADRDDRLIVISAVTTPDSSLSTIKLVTRTLVSTTTIHRRLIERNLFSYRLLRQLPLTPAHCQARLLWCLARSAQQYVNDILRAVLLPFLLQYCGLIFQQDNTRPHMERVDMNFLLAFQALPWPARSPDFSPIESIWDMMERQL